MARTEYIDIIGEDICPICSKKLTLKGCQKKRLGGYASGTGYYCCTENIHFITSDFLNSYSDKERIIFYNLISDFYSNIVEKTEDNYIFFYDKNSPITIDYERKKVNLFSLLPYYPNTIEEKIRKGFYNISKHFPDLGQEIVIDKVHHTLIYGDTNDFAYEREAFFDLLMELGYLYRKTEYIEQDKRIKVSSQSTISRDNYNPLAFYNISAKGWMFLSSNEFRQKNQVFIAMKFYKADKTDGEANLLKSIYNSFSSAISRCGYKPIKMDDYEHNEQIVPEILYQISISKFVVVDITVPNFGAYYEAGYAQGLKKEVIYCCSQEIFESVSEKPHFDVSQRSMIIWKNYEELENKLYRRIEAVIGLNDTIKI